jgi:ribosome-binding factor A
VTHVITSSDLRSARVLVSIRGHEAERSRMLGQLRHHHAEFQRRLAENVILKYTPVLHFELDGSLESGDRVLNLLSELEPPPAAAPASAPTAEKER